MCVQYHTEEVRDFDMLEIRNRAQYAKMLTHTHTHTHTPRWCVILTLLDIGNRAQYSVKISGLPPLTSIVQLVSPT